MADRSQESLELYEILMDREYPSDFCEMISRILNTTWTANRMLGYLRYMPHLKEEDIVDEMLGILSDRDRIRRKKEMEFYQGKINELYANGLDNFDEDNDA
ncbi:MAG: hypothetical protein KBS96_06610 [Lachnospiraceae bacterium]|nr:hypothetical protein [Candidatus Colinaster scatohippi]